MFALVFSLHYYHYSNSYRVLHAWSYIVRRRSSQRRIGEKFARLRQHRQVASAFMTMRSRFDYCQGLKEAADSMCARRDRNLAKLAMERWKVRLFLSFCLTLDVMSKMFAFCFPILKDYF